MNARSTHGGGTLRCRTSLLAPCGALASTLLLVSCAARQPVPEPPPRLPKAPHARPTVSPGLETRRPETRPAPAPVERSPVPEVFEAPTEEETLARTPTSVEPESVLAYAGPGTAPHVTTALRLVEDGRQRMDAGDYDAALDLLERAVAIDPANPYGYYFLARVHHLQKNYDQAVAFANRSVVLSASDPVWRGRAYCLQAAAFEEAGRYSDARRAYQQAMLSDPNNVTARVGAVRLSGTR